MSSRAVRLYLSICLCPVSVASTAGAQELASSIEQLRVLVRPGDTVKVTDTSGREVKGSISSLTGTSLAPLVNGHPLTLSEAEIQTIRQGKHPISKSARNGFLAGARSVCCPEWRLRRAAAVPTTFRSASECTEDLAPRSDSGSARSSRRTS